MTRKLKSKAINPDLSGIGAYITIPSGSTAQRPVSPTVGMVRYNTDLGNLEQYTASGWGSIAPPPVVASVSPLTYNGEQGSLFTINGTGFGADVSVKFVTTQGTEYTAATIARISSAQLTATTPQDFTVANEPLAIKVIQGSGSFVTANLIDCGGTPTWNTSAGTLTTVNSTDPVYVVISATDPDSNATISYSVTSGSSLPSGVIVNSSSGLISGNIPSVSSSTTYNFNLSALDNAGNETQRSFSIVNNPIPNIAIFGSAFDGQLTASNGGLLTINNSAGNQAALGTNAWSNYSTGITSDSNLNGYQGNKSINDSDSLCGLLLTQPARVYMFRSSGWNPVSTSGWTSYNSTVYIAAASPGENYYKDFAAGTHYLDNNSAMYIVQGSSAPTTIGYAPMTRLIGSQWFSAGYYGVDTGYQLNSGFHVTACDWVTASTAVGGRIWMFVMEKDVSVSSRFYIRAGWMFTDPNPGNGYRRTLRTADATTVVGNVDVTTKMYKVPVGGHLASGQYYLGWYSGDPAGGTQPNAAIHVQYTEGTEATNAGGGRIHYVNSQTVATQNLQIDFTSLNTGRNMIMAMHGY